MPTGELLRGCAHTPLASPGVQQLSIVTMCRCVAICCERLWLWLRYYSQALLLPLSLLRSSAPCSCLRCYMPAFDHAVADPLDENRW